MKIDNPLSREFLLHHPADAARTLEKVSVEYVAALFTELTPQLITDVLVSMLPETAAACLDVMSTVSAAKLVAELPVTSMTRIFRFLPEAKQKELSSHLTKKVYSQLRRHLLYPVGTAGALLNSRIDMLPQNVTVADAIRRIERRGRPISCEIYIIDDAHHLVGLVNLGRLLTLNRHIKLSEIMDRKTKSISAYATIETLLSHPGWTKRRSLPVVERDFTLVGELDFSTVQNLVGDIKTDSSQDPLENLMSLPALYWLSVAQLLDSMLSTSVPRKGKQQ